MPTHDTGLWLTEDGKVVDSPPEGASTQLVAKGGEISAAAKARLEQAGVTVDDTDPQEPDAVTTDEAAPKKAPAKKAAAKKAT